MMFKSAINHPDLEEYKEKKEGYQFCFLFLRLVIATETVAADTVIATKPIHGASNPNLSIEPQTPPTGAHFAADNA